MKNIILKSFIFLAFIFLFWSVLVASNKLDEQRHQAYENCEPMVDIDGNWQMVCK